MDINMKKNGTELTVEVVGRLDSLTAPELEDSLEEVYDGIEKLILDLANRGKTVLVVSSEMPELLGICDRILVMSGGRLAGEVDARNTTQEEIMTLAAKYV